MRRAGLLPLLLVSLVVLSGCYFRDQVESSEVGLRMGDGVTIEEVVAAGRYTDMGPWAGLAKIDVSAQRIHWSDPALVTNDSQPIGLELEVVYHRRRDEDSIRHMWNNYRSQAQDNEALEEMVRGRIPAAAKEVVARYQLPELLGVGDVDEGGRSVVAAELTELLAPRVEEFGVELVEVGIVNYHPDPEYLDLLQEKANVIATRDVQAERTRQLTELKAQEEAQTEVDLEIARRERAVHEEQATVYAESPELYELERLKLLADVLGEQNTVYFVPGDSSLNVFLDEAGQARPIIEEGAEAEPAPEPEPQAEEGS